MWTNAAICGAITTSYSEWVRLRLERVVNCETLPPSEPPPQPCWSEGEHLQREGEEKGGTPRSHLFWVWQLEYFFNSRTTVASIHTWQGPPVSMFVKFQPHLSTMILRPPRVNQEDPYNFVWSDAEPADGGFKDWDYAHRSSYPNYGSEVDIKHLADQNFTRTPSQPYRLATSYRWIDDECPIQEVNVEEFCAACVVLGIHQILVLGDSLNTEFVQSLQSLLGFPPKGRRATVLTARFQPWTMACPTNSPSSLGHTTITFWMMKYAPHSDWKKLGEEARNKSGRARNFIDKSKHKTAIVANLGAWMQDRTQYEEAFTWFLEWMESLTDPSKVVPFWRPSVPGHLGCHPEGKKEEITQYNWVKPVLQEPYTDYLDYKQTQDIFMAKDNADPGTNQRWEYFEGWNDWSYHKMYRTNSTTFGT